MSSNTITEIRCDFCDADVPEAWVYSHPAFQYLVSPNLVDVENGAVAACQYCRHYLETRDHRGLLERVTRILGLGGTSYQLLANYYALLVKYIFADVQHWKLGGERVPGPRFFNYVCSRCNHVLQYDTQSYKRWISGKCPGCGITITQIGRPGPEKGN